MTHKNYIRTAGLLTCLALTQFGNMFAGPKKPNTEKPNILFVFTDQQTINAMSCSGNAYLETPAMDRLAATGVRFEQSYCTSPVCAPSRSSMITSRMPHETGYDFNRSPREEPREIEFPTMGEILHILAQSGQRFLLIPDSVLAENGH